MTTKKELKDIINQNGFFLNMHVNKVERSDMIERLTNAKDSVVITKESALPTGDNIEFFSGKATTGDKNRNGYIIETEAWDWSNYKANPQILYQHQDDKPIGRAINLNRNGESWDIDFFIDYNTMEEKEAYRVKNGYVNALSTGHLTKELIFRHDKTGEEITESEYVDKWMNGDDIEDYTMVVTKAEAIENSIVTIPSNVKAVTVKNALENYVLNFKKNLMEKKTQLEGDNAKLENEVSETTEETTSEAKDTEISSEATEEVTEETVEMAENAEDTVVEAEAENAEEETKEDSVLVDSVLSLAKSVSKQQEQLDYITKKLDKLSNEPAENKVLSMDTQHEPTKRIDQVSQVVDSIQVKSKEGKLRMPKSR